MSRSIPQHWVETTLEDVVEIRDDLRQPVNAKERAIRTGDIPYYGATGQVGWIDDYLMEGEFVLLGEDGAPFLDPTRDKAYLINGKAWVNNHAHVLKGRENVLENRFLLYLLNQTDYRDFANGTTRLKLTQGAMRRIPIPLAPLNEQRRIVAKIEELFSELDAGVAALERAKANLKRYRASVLKAAVDGSLTADWRAKHPKVEPASQLLERILAERRRRWEEEQLAKFAAAGKKPPKDWEKKYKEPGSPETEGLAELPEGWCWAKLDQVQLHLRNGYFQSPSKGNQGTRILRISAVRPMNVNLDEVRLLDNLREDAEGYFIEDGDLLFTRYNGSLHLLGVGGMVRGVTHPTLHPDKLIRVQVAEPATISPFAEIAVNTGMSRRFIESRARTTAGQTGISGGDVREMPIPLPTLDEQREIVKIVWERLSQIEHAELIIEFNLKRSARLRQSILKQAFEGKLVPQDPADEPAEIMLVKILAQKAEKKPKAAPKLKKRVKLPKQIFQHRASVVSYTVERLATRQSFGRIQLLKTMHLAQCHLGIEMGFTFERYEAGPFDPAIYPLEKVAAKEGWFSTKERKRYGVTYHPGEKIDEIRQHAVKFLGEKKAELDHLLDHIAQMNTDEAELFATAYAAWNDLLLDGRPADDDAIIEEIYAWHPKKKKFTAARIKARLEWMSESKFRPTGRGTATRARVANNIGRKQQRSKASKIERNRK